MLRHHKQQINPAFAAVVIGMRMASKAMAVIDPLMQSRFPDGVTSNVALRAVDYPAVTTRSKEFHPCR
jgi:hypothetical protein